MKLVNKIKRITRNTHNIKGCVIMLEKIEETLEFIWRKTGYRPKIAIILGSGLVDLLIK